MNVSVKLFGPQAQLAGRSEVSVELIDSPATIAAVRQAGVSRLAVSLDGVGADTHDSFRGVPGSYARTLAILRDARELEFPTQVSTTITRRNAHPIDALAEMLARSGIVLWPVFFLVRVGRGLAAQLPARCRGCRFLGVCDGSLRTRAGAAAGDWLGMAPSCYLRDEEITRG